MKLNKSLKSYLDLSLHKKKVSESKTLNNPELKELILEQYALLTQIKESEIKKTTVITKENLLNYFYSRGYSGSIIIESIAEYIVRAIPKLTLKNFHKFLVEGLLSEYINTQKQICFSIYSNFSDKLYLSQVYSYFDDPLCQVIIEDLIVMHDILKREDREMKFSIPSKGLPRIDKSEERYRTQQYPFLIIETTESDLDAQVSSLNETEVSYLLEKKNTWMEYKAFSELDMTPALFLFMAHLVCGKNIMDYHSEVNNTKIIRYIYLKNKNRDEHFIDKKNADPIKNSLQRERKALSKRIMKSNPNARAEIIDVAIRVFQRLRGQNNSKEFITEEQFTSNSVLYNDMTLGFVFW